VTPDLARARLVAELTQAGVLDDDWRPVFESVPRDAFIPSVVWQVGRGGRLVALRRDEDPDRWWEIAYRNRPVDTQVDDGHPAEDGTGWEVTSSASQPSVVAKMLTALRVEPGMRVLEIGTGTGYNAALLAQRVGQENVTTIEVDPAVAEHARAALDAAGYSKVAVITGDGAEGWAEGAPYDRVIATVSAREVPYSWIGQTVPGGRVVVPLRNAYHPPGLATLTVRADGTASGRLGYPLLFMGLRAQRVPRPTLDHVGAPEVTGETALHPHRWAGHRDAAMAIGQRVGDGVATHYEAVTDTTGVMWLIDPGTRSWAAVDVAPRPPYRVRQSGPRRLVDEVLAGYRWWQEQGEPGVDAWLVTVGVDGRQTIELSGD
jgi:protein-L-isoaspartate O-methyltransferase